MKFKGMKGTIRWAICFLLIVVSSPFLLWAADGFREFRFGDSPEMVKRISGGLCSYGNESRDTRWLWRTNSECNGYTFKGNTRVKLYFQFSGNELAKIHVVSKEIPHYFLIRYPEYNYMLPKQNPNQNSGMNNLVDEKLLQDKIHKLAGEYSYITFFYEGNWEWEYIYARKGYTKEETERTRDTLEEEANAGVAGWSKFNFNETQKQIKDKLEGMCGNLTVEPSDRIEVLRCNAFTFLDTKVDAFFIFESTGLSMIELKLKQDWYSVLLPLLKKKYGLPYLEITDNEIYYPSIEFPKANVVLAHKRAADNPNEIQVALKYIKQGYEDKDQQWVRSKQESEQKKTPRSKTERILDSI